MTLAEYLEQAASDGRGAPANLRSQETVQALADQAMGLIRQDMARTKRLALAAKRTARSLGDALSIGRAERISGHVELLAGRAKKAVPRYESARQNFAEHPDERAATAVAMLQALAYVGDYDRAFEVGDEALSWFLGARDAFKAARVRANLGNALHRLDRLAEAKAHYEAALPELAKAKALGDLAIVTRNYGVCLMGLLELDQAEEMYRTAREVFVGAEQNLLVLEVDLNRAYLRGRQGRLREALVMYRRLRTDLPAELGFEIGHCLLDQADFMLEAGLWTDCRVAASQSRLIFEKLEAKFEVGKTELIEGFACLRMGQIEEARTLIRSAARRLKKEPNSNWQALAHQALAEMNDRLGQKLGALKELLLAEQAKPTDERAPWIRRSLVDIQLDLGMLADAEVRLSEHPDHALIAKHHRLAGRADEAESHAREALAAYDSRRGQQGPARLRQAVEAASESELRECFRALRRPEERMMAAARLKNQSLAEITESPEAIPESDELQALRARLADSTAQSREDREQQLQNFWREVKSLADAGFTDRVEMELPRSGERFAEIFADSGQLFAFLSDSDGSRELCLGNAAEFATQARFLRFHLRRQLDHEGAGARAALAWFGDRLAALWEGDLTRLVVGRAWPLESLPFHALGFETADVVYAPSGLAWSAVRRSQRNPGDGAFVVGAADALAPHIAHETKVVADALGVSPASASRLEEFAPRAQLLHLAAHGIVREDRPMFSAMQLGDRELTVFDIMQMRLSAELTTLSGCSTGLSRPGDEKSTEGFIESFLAAGSRSVLASLWDVPDEPTAHWMSEFYAAWPIQGACAAFRLACLSTKERWPHPAAWASFGLFGDPR